LQASFFHFAEGQESLQPDRNELIQPEAILQIFEAHSTDDILLLEPLIEELSTALTEDLEEHCMTCKKNSGGWGDCEVYDDYCRYDTTQFHSVVVNPDAERVRGIIIAFYPEEPV